MTARSGLAGLVAALALTGCSPDGPVAEPPLPSSPPTSPAPPAPSRPTGTPTPTSEPSSESPAPEPGTVPPPWLGTRPLPLRPDGFGQAQPTPPELDPRRFTLPDTVAPLPGDGFASRVEPVPADVLARSTWSPGCPVAAHDLAYVRLAFWGFDDQRHTGELLLAASVADDVVTVFEKLYEERFPFEELRVTPRSELDAPPTGDGNGTGAFVCRPTTGSTTTFSQHAYGLAIDLDPFQNPYSKGDLVLPELASAYLDRDRVRPGMITPDGVVVRAFASIGWTWGGTWSSLKDYQHFSQNGR
ncbi:M15 family metallopeptidase [Nocardioides halotolerans]|uniref:M15 family metallopeptidase n=1 Tax=Nocardioides halotolerans TaxID=433660 RepID=UPI0004241C98|nr:M15 family metallopeptidase [Nocardioides halotolerans]